MLTCCCEREIRLEVVIELIWRFKYMGDFIGVVKLEKDIPCLKEVSGKTFKSRIAGQDVLIIFPSIPDDYNPEHVDLVKGDLVVSPNLFVENVNWGRVNVWPLGLFSVNAILCYVSCEKSNIKEIYEEFPRWKEKLNNLRLIDSGNYMQPRQKVPSLLKGGGFDDGLQIFEVIKEEPLQYVRNSRTTEPIRIQFTEIEESYSMDQLTDLFTNVGSNKEIALPYELLIMAYQAMERHDFRSAVILGGTAVEQAALRRLRKEYTSNNKFKIDKNKQKFTTLGGKFHWLSEKSVSIPVSDYKKTIVDVRNDATHDGIRPSYGDTKVCLENCKKLIKEYNPNILEE